MSGYVWNGGDGVWDSGNWSGGTETNPSPGVGDTALIGSGDVVSEQGNEDNSILSLTIDSGAGFEVAYGYPDGPDTLYGSSFAISNGLTNAGGITIDDACSLYVGGVLDNSGTISIDSSSAPSGASPLGDPTALMLGNVTLKGGGTIVMSDYANNYIEGGGNGTPYKLVNVNNTIEGSGQITVGNGYFALTITNGAAGVIDADQSVGLTIALGNDLLTNAGLIESTSSGGLLFNATTIKNTGTISATGTGGIDLQNETDIEGGVLSSASGSMFQIVAGGANSSNTLDGLTAGTLTLATGTTVQVDAGQQLFLYGTIVNKGSIDLAAVSANTNLFMGGTTVTLKGAGKIVLSNSAGNQILGADTSSTHDLVNVNNTIEGAGDITVGNGSFAMNVTNESAGIIDADQTSTLTISLGNDLLTNQGLIEATGAGGLLLDHTTVANTGTFLAAGAGNDVYLQNESDIQGGTLNATGGGMFQIVSGGSNSYSTLDGSASSVKITATTTVQADDGQQLVLLGTINNLGSIALDSTGDGTNLFMDGTVTLTGGGKLVLSNNGNNQVLGSDNSTTNGLINVNNTIEGAGQILVGNGSFAMTVDNEAAGVIKASQTSGLTIQLGADTLTNAGLIEDTNTGGLLFNGTTVANTGTILASGDGHNVYFQNETTIQGGTLTSTGGGLIEIVAGGNNSYNTLDGSTATVTITTGSTVQVNDSQVLRLLGTITNKGTIKLDSAGGGTNLIIDGAPVTLTGGGVIQLSNNGNNLIQGIGGTATPEELINVNNTIKGAGVINGGGYSNFALTNEAAGVINANQAATLTIQFGSNVLTNAGLIEDTNTGGLLFNGTTVANTGTILASGAGDDVYLQNETTIQGGTLSSTGGGVIEAVAGGNNSYNVLDGSASAVTITTGSTVQVNNGQSLLLRGTIDNKGTIKVASTGGGTVLDFDSSPVTLTGGGKVVLSNSENNTLLGQGGGAVMGLVNVNNTIQGAGYLAVGNGYSSFTLDNQTAGVIDADDSNALWVQLGGNLLTNAGLMEATGLGTLYIQGTNTVTNTGTIEANGSAAIVIVIQSTHINGGSLVLANGGTFAIDTSSTADFTAASSIDGTIQSGTVTLAGATAISALKLASAAILNDNGTVTQSGAATITNGSISIATGAAYDFSANGGIAVNLASGGSAALSNAGTLAKTGGTGTTTVAVTTSSTGTIAASSGILDFTGSVSVAGNISGAGEVDFAAATITGDVLDTAATLRFLGALDIGATLTVQGGTAYVDEKPSGSGGFAIGAGGTLDFGAAVGAAQTVNFLGDTGDLVIEKSGSFAAAITNFVSGDSIDLVNLALSGISAYHYNNNVLTLYTASGTETLDIVGNFVRADFTLATDHAGTGTVITVS